VLDAGTRRELAVLTPENFSETKRLAFSPDGRLLAVVLEGIELVNARTYTLQVWDWKARRMLWSRAVREPQDVEFAPGGKTLAMAADAQYLYDAASGKPMGEPFGGTGQGVTVTDVIFTRDGGSLAVVDSAGRLTVYDTATRRQSGQAIRGRLTGGPGDAVRSPREDVVAASTRDGRVQLFDLAAGASLGMLGDGNLDGVQSLAFAADGSKVLVLDYTGAVREQLVEPGRVAAAVCARAGTPLSAAEWQRFIMGAPYRAICP
jgi:WD40 repeat protein